MLGLVLVVTTCHVNVHAAPVAVTLSGRAVVSLAPPTSPVNGPFTQLPLIWIWTLQNLIPMHGVKTLNNQSPD